MSPLNEASPTRARAQPHPSLSPRDSPELLGSEQRALALVVLDLILDLELLKDPDNRLGWSDRSQGKSKEGEGQPSASSGGLGRDAYAAWTGKG